MVILFDFSYSVKLLLPAMFYSLYIKSKNKSVRLVDQWYLLLPFLVFTILHVGLSFFIPYSSNAISLWVNWYDVVYSVYALFIVVLLFIGLPNYPVSTQVQKYSLVRELNLLMLMMAGGVYMHIYFSHSGEPYEVDYSNLLWKLILWMVLLASIFLKINYLFKRKEYQTAKNYLPPKEERLQDYTKKLKYLFEDRKIYLRQDLNKRILSIESGISTADLDYFFNQYIEKDFNLFIAEYRISYALELIHKKGDRYTLSTISQECGYKSKSTFNKYFTIITGDVPFRYLNKKKVKQ